MIEPVVITRGGKQYNVFRGVETGESTLYIESVLPIEKGLKERFYFISLYIEADKTDKKGRVNLIKTEWRRSLISPTEEVFDEFTEVWVNTNAQDRAVFNTMFGNPILMSMVNGLIRDPWGYDELPVYDTRLTIEGVSNPNFGLLRVYTEIEELSQPTKKYGK